MKNNLILLITILLFASCEKPDHKIRVKNDFSEEIKSLAVGDVIFDNIKSGTTTEYKPINKGSFSIDGRTATGIVTGDGKIRGNGKHNWTLNFDVTGKAILKEDI
jgi:hypothetical protein